jgi:hypothetical protein
VQAPFGKHTSGRYISSFELAFLVNAPVILHLRIDFFTKVFSYRVAEVSCKPGGIDNYIGRQMGSILEYETVFSV